MNACAQAMERFRADITAHVGLIETSLALGADPAATIAPYIQTLLSGEKKGLGHNSHD
jgi:putative ABC transport system permease protein